MVDRKDEQLGIALTDIPDGGRGTVRFGERPRAREDFNRARGEERRDAGIEAAASRRYMILVTARNLAYQIAREKGQVTADDVQEALLGLGISPEALGNAAGGIFRTGDWVRIGYEKSRRASNNARVVAIWRRR